jgi:hypothetical protein
VTGFAPHEYGQRLAVGFGSQRGGVAEWANWPVARRKVFNHNVLRRATSLPTVADWGGRWPNAPHEAMGSEALVTSPFLAPFDELCNETR